MGIRPSLVLKKLYTRFLINSRIPKGIPLLNNGVGITSEITYIRSLSQLARDFIVSIAQTDIPYALLNTAIPFRRGDLISQKEIEAFKKLECHTFNQRHVIHFSTIPCYKNKRYCNAITPFWEFQSGMLEHRPGLFDGADVIIAYSDFLKEYYESLVPSGVRVLKFRYPYSPIKVDLPEKVFLRKMFNLSESSFVVFFNFDYSSSYERKNPEGALKAFAAAFMSASYDACMVFKTSHSLDHPIESKKLRSLAAELGISNRTFFVDDYMPREKLLFLTACSDAYISLHRGEGLGMGMLEAMTLGIPVVATDFGGNTDFVNIQTAYPVPYKLTAAKSDMPAYDFVSEWAQPDVEVAASFLRQIYSDREEAKQKISKAKNFIESNYSNENFRNDLLTFLAI